MKLFYLLIILLLNIPLTAQKRQTTFDPRLQAVFEVDYLNNLKTNNPVLIQRWNFYLDHAYYLAAFNPQKFPQNLPEVSIKDVNHINILQLEKEQNIHKDWDLPKAYRIKNTPQILVYYSGKEFNKRLNQFLRNEN